MVAISIVIPIHNEAEFLVDAWPRLRADLDRLNLDVEVLLVENGSTDETLKVAQDIDDPRLTVLALPTPDYGAAMRTGFLEAAGSDWVVNFDIDYFSADFVRWVLEDGLDADVVIASKRAPGSDDRRSALRRAGTLTFNTLLRALFGSRVSDTHGIKAFRGEILRDLVPATTRTQDLFDTELVLRAEMAGYRILEVPVIVEELRAARSSFVRRVPRTVRGLLQLRRSFSSERRNTRSL
jgi:glycosyltransferase involved in cell wall biosynthesis